jgi:hypothetical protein
MLVSGINGTRTGRWLSPGQVFIALSWLFFSTAHAQTTNYELGTTNLLVGPTAGINSIVLGVTPPAGGWTATANDAWLHLSGENQSGTGSTNVIFSYDANRGGARSGTFSIGDQTLIVTQAGSTYVSAGTFTTLVSSGLHYPNGVAVDGVGNVYIGDHAEIIADTIAHAAALLHSAEAAGKKVTPGNVAYYAIKLTRSGRRSTGSSATDVLHPGTQLAGRARVVSFDEPLGMDDTGAAITLGDVFANDQEDPGTLAARNMDWETFFERQTHRGRMLLTVVAEGRTLRHVARMIGVSDSGIQLEKKKLAVALAEFMGANILAEVNRQPMWRNNITAGRERQACRAARV